MMLNRRHRLMLMTFLATLAETIAQQGAYFYTKHQFDFTDSQNLTLAFVGGLLGICGARTSGRLARRFGERNMLYILFGTLVALAILQMIHPSPVTVCIGASVAFFCSMGGWPLVESYIASGLHGKQVSRAMGWFNLSWAPGIPLGIIMAGKLIDLGDRAMFVGAGVCALAALALAATLEAKPIHLPEDHEHRLRGATQRRYFALMTAGRWMMLSHTTLMFIVLPLIPGITRRMELSVVAATAAASILHVMRLVAFIVMQSTTVWHNRVSYLAVLVAVLPIGFVSILLCETMASTFGVRLAVLVGGQILAGVCGPVAYHTALYYTMVLNNASVEAGGEHESMAATGLVMGPGAALIGGRITTGAFGPVLGAAPVWLFCTVRTVRSLVAAAATEEQAS